jgi:hypothetical protein
LLQKPWSLICTKIRKLDEDLQRQWIKAVAAQCGEKWKTCLITGNLTSLDPSLSDPSLVIGPQQLLRRFCNAIASNEEVSINYPKEEARRLESWIEPWMLPGLVSSIDYLPDPSEIPRYPEEGRLDPFGQNLHLLDSAWSTIAEFVGKLARQAHAQGIAITLPYSSSGQDKSAMKPWRMVVSLAPSSGDQNLSESMEQFSLSLPDTQEKDFGLGLIQRCLLIFTLLFSDAATIDEWHNLGMFVEELGYILVSRSIDIRSRLCPEGLKGEFLKGQYAAERHADNWILGDMHPGNFLYEAPNDQNPMGELQVIDIPETARILDHPITALERAKDLAIIKLCCGFTAWEAVKLGYRSVAAREAEEVFQLI